MITEKLRPPKELPPFQLHLGPGFVLLIAVLYFFDTSGLLLALAPAVAIHELGHMAALVSLGNPPRALKASLSGLSLDYSGEMTKAGKMISALTGPACGVLFSWLCAVLGNWLESDFLLLSSGSGLALNLFNLLPASPLDGGQALASLLEFFMPRQTAARVMLLCGTATACALLVFGGIFFSRGLGFALIPAGLWLLILQIPALRYKMHI
jgi:hypothetical protein